MGHRLLCENSNNKLRTDALNFFNTVRVNLNFSKLAWCFASEVAHERRTLLEYLDQRQAVFVLGNDTLRRLRYWAAIQRKFSSLIYVKTQEKSAVAM